jgi:hypothetical protein
MKQAAQAPMMCQKMCHLAFSGTVREGTKADPKPLTSTNVSGPRRARTDDLRIKSPQLYQLS